jgi:hypothetical protein
MGDLLSKAKMHRGHIPCQPIAARLGKVNYLDKALLVYKKYTNKYTNNGERL